MIWPGTNDPAKRKKTIRFLIITAIIAISVSLASVGVQSLVGANDPLKACIDPAERRNLPYRITATLEVTVDGELGTLQRDIGTDTEKCHRSITLADDGTIDVAWSEEYPFEIGHILWSAGFPLRDMEQSKSAIYVNGDKSPHFIAHPLQDGFHYRAEFVSKAYDESKDSDFLPTG